MAIHLGSVVVSLLHVRFAGVLVWIQLSIICELSPTPMYVAPLTLGRGKVSEVRVVANYEDDMFKANIKVFITCFCLSGRDQRRASCSRAMVLNDNRGSHRVI